MKVWRRPTLMRGVALALFFVLGMAPPTSGADWAVKRSDRSLFDLSLDAALARPDDDAIGKRLVGLARKTGFSAALSAIGARALRAPASYALAMTEARVLNAAGQFEAAAESYARAAKMRPGATAYVGAASAWTKAGQMEKSLVAWGLALRSSGRVVVSQNVANQLVVAARREDQLVDLAAQLSRHAQAKTTGSLWAVIAKVREELADDQAAIAAWQKATLHDPDKDSGWRGLIGLLERLGRTDEVAAAENERIRRSPGALDPVIESIERQYARGAKNEGRKRLDQAIGLHHGDAQGLIRLADTASKLGQDDRVFICWQQVLRLRPTDERAILMLGEAHFLQGRRELAQLTWQKLLRTIRPRGTAHARLAELLLDHQALDAALQQIQVAVRLEPGVATHKRILARILEDRRETVSALSAWQAYLAQSVGTDAKKEARTRILGLLGRSGSASLLAERTRLTEQLKSTPNDRDAALLRAQIDLALAEPARAVEVLQGAAALHPDDGELVLLLVRLLKQSQQVQKAADWLQKLADAAPARAAEAYFQMGELRFSYYQDDAGLAAFDRARAASPSDANLWLRVAEVEARVGQRDRALKHFIESHRLHPSARAVLSAANLLAQNGDTAAQQILVDEATAHAPTAAARTEVLAASVDLAEINGQIPRWLHAWVTETGDNPAADPRPFIEVMNRHVPVLYQAAAHDPGAAEKRAALGRLGLRPLLDIAEQAEAVWVEPAIDLLGILGNGSAAPTVARLGARSDGAFTARAVRALGRLGDTRGGPFLMRLADDPSSSLRSAALWALGRLPPDKGSLGLFQAALSDGRADVAAMAGLGLGRSQDAQAQAALHKVALDPLRNPWVRIGAVLGLGLYGNPISGGHLLPLLDAPDDVLRAAVATTLGVLRAPDSVGILLQTAVAGAAAPRRAARLALLIWNAGRGFSDEARALGRDEVSAPAVMRGLIDPVGRDLQTNDAGMRVIAGRWADEIRALRGPGQP